MIEKTAQLMNSLLFGFYDKDKDNSDLLNKIVFDAATTSSQEISLAAKQISSIYTELSKSEGEEVLSGFREFIQQMALNYDTKTSSFTALLWKDMLQHGNKQALSSLFENYSFLQENDRELGNLLMNQSVLTYEKFGYNTASSYISSVNKIFEVGRESDNLKGTLKDFLSTWKDISNLEDLSLRQRQNSLEDFATTIKNSNSLEDIQNSIENYKNNLA